MKRRVVSIGILILLAGCSGFKGLTFRVPTISMAPTIKPGDLVFCDPIFYKHSSVARGDLVPVLDPDGKKRPDGTAEMYPRRVIGLGGDKVQILSGKVYVNDQVLNGLFGTGKYFSDYPIENFGPIAVPVNEYFLVGDNLANSYDSRDWKRSTVRVEDIYGKVTQIKDKDTGELRSL